MDLREEVQSGKGFEGGGNEEGGDHGEAMSCGRGSEEKIVEQDHLFLCVPACVCMCV